MASVRPGVILICTSFCSFLHSSKYCRVLQRCVMIGYLEKEQLCEGNIILAQTFVPNGAALDH